MRKKLQRTGEKKKQSSTSTTKKLAVWRGKEQQATMPTVVTIQHRSSLMTSLITL
jgi:hypothetical protein